MSALPAGPGKGDCEKGERKKSSGGRSGYDTYVLPCVAEFFGTGLFVFTGCASLIENSPGTGRLQPAVAHGFALAISVAITAGVSGGHMNPAVSLGAALCGGLNVFLLIPFWAAQFCGGLVGAGLARAVSSDARFINASGGAFTSIKTDEQVAGALVAEIVMTFYLVLTVCMSAINKQSKTPLAPFCIGLTLTVAILGGGGVSGACLNPARALGPAVVANYWPYHWVYWVGPLIAAVIVGVVLRLLLGDPGIRLVMKTETFA
ncbi:aquaporin-8-like [Anguilla anguilla]|uniref:aquaporin-8-like n=1 Tax=Anguilla anguilla TaxID=7936 RepID=UPI0015B133F2|nr:aquaporin-8-like [Anguilla anguilla]XP_035266902.1 aquaporin-8-like [Anguilla anguilla]